MINRTLFKKEHLRLVVHPVYLLYLTVFLQCTPPPTGDPFVYQKDGIQIDIHADQKLNTYDGVAHSLKLVIYQLTDNSAFLQNAATTEGARKLLKTENFDQSVVGYEQVIIKPNDAVILSYDRITGAKWVGVVAGYYKNDDLPPPSVVLQIPSVPDRKSIFRRLFEKTGLLTSSEKKHVPQFLIQLMMTPSTMYETSSFR